MKAIDTEIPDVKIIEPQLFGDARGYFFESFNQSKFNECIGRNVIFVQDNHSKSKQGVLRGLHYQLPPHEQGKLVRVIEGEVFDVAVDIRLGSPTFQRWVGVLLSAENKRQLWIPPGFAHAFLVLSMTAQFLYKTTDYWHRDLERSIIWNDNDINIKWPSGIFPIVSEKDRLASAFCDADLF